MVFSSDKKKLPLISLIPLVVGTILLLVVASLLTTGAFMISKATSPTPSPNSEAGEVVYDEDGAPSIDWDYWQSVNADIVAWITVPGTDIDYPVVQAHADNPEYYNYHDVYGNYSIFGCPFLHPDNEQTGILNSKNAVLQGHNIRGLNSKMFSAFANYTNEAYANEHSKIILQTPTDKLIVKVFSVEVIANAGWNTALQLNFETDELFKTYVDDCINNSCVVVDENKPTTQMWTFSTCSYFVTPDNERTVVHCSLDRHVKLSSEVSISNG